MKSIPVSLAIVGVTTILLGSALTTVAASAADWAGSRAAAEPVPVVPVRDATDASRYSRERVWPGHGGAKLEHHFGIHPDDPERPHYRKYYPYVWGGYAFSAPYFVGRHDYWRPEYGRLTYGKAQKNRWYRDWKRDVGEAGRW